MRNRYAGIYFFPNLHTAPGNHNPKQTKEKDLVQQMLLYLRLPLCCFVILAASVCGRNVFAETSLPPDINDPIVTLNANTTYTVNGNNSVGTISGNITDDGQGHSITKKGDGTLVLGGRNTYGGGTVLTGGTLVLGHDEALGTWAAGNPAVTQNGMLLAKDGDVTISVTENRTIKNHFQLGDAATDQRMLTFDVAASKTLTVSGVENTSSESVGGAISVNMPDVNDAEVINMSAQLTFKGKGSVAFAHNTADLGGAIGISIPGTAAPYTNNQHVNFNARALSSLTFNSNAAQYYGGGVYVSSRSETPSSLSFGDHVTFMDNSAGRGGGGVYFFSISSKPSLLSFNDHVSFINNTAGSSGGGVQVYSTTPSFLTFKNYITFTDNLAGDAGYGSGGGISVFFDYINMRSTGMEANGGTDNGGPSLRGTSRSLTLCKYLTFSGNIAGNKGTGYGGGIYVSSAFGNYLTELGSNVLMTENRAGGNNLGGQGGAIFVSHDLFLSGHTFFKNNLVSLDSERPLSPGSLGGAIYMGGDDESVLILDSTDGPIAFSGNRINVDTTLGAAPSGGELNAIHLAQNTQLTLCGSNNIYFDDPISSGALGNNSLFKSGAGFVQFVGANTLNPTGKDGGDVMISDGTFRLADGPGATPSSFTARGEHAEFILAGETTLAGQGTITAEKGFTLSGTVSPDADRFAIPTFAEKGDAGYGATPDNYNFFLNDKPTVVSDAKKIGTLTLVGDVTLKGATLAVDADGVSSDAIKVQGKVTFDPAATNTIVPRTGTPNGTYDIVTATSEMTLGTDTFAKITGTGADGYSYVRGSAVRLKDGDRKILQLTLDTTANLTMTWTGAANTAWSTAATALNWTNNPGGTAEEPRFLSGDDVIFPADAAGKSVSVAPSGVLVNNMEVRGSGYTFKLTAGNTPALSAAGDIDLGESALDIVGYVPGENTSQGAPQNVQTIVRSGGALSGFTGAVSVAGQPNADFMTACAFQNGNNIDVHTSLAWYADGVDSMAHGHITINGAENTFTLGAALVDNSSLLNKEPGWDGNSLVKQGSGTLILTGANTYTGITTVAGGRLLVGGSAADVNAAIAGDAEVAGGAVLGGHGTIRGHILVQPGGTLAPGSPAVGVLQAGAATFTPGSVFDVKVNPEGTAADLLQVAGTATLQGGTVRLSALPALTGGLPVEGEWLILSANTVSGTFAEQVDTLLLPFLAGSLTYGLDFVSLSLQRSAEFESFGRTPNQRAVARGLQSLDAASPVYNAVVGMAGTPADVRAVYDQLSGEIHPSLPGALMGEDRRFAQRQRERLSARNAASAAPAKFLEDKYGLWIEVDGHRDTVEQTSNTAKSEFKSWGVNLGAERTVYDWTLGAAFHYGNGEYKLRSRESKADLESFNFGLYASRPLISDFYLKLGAGYGLHQVDTTRHVSFMSETLEADYTIHTFQAFTELSYALDFGAFGLEPYAGLAWNMARSESFTEQGGNAALRAKSETNDNVSSELGARIHYYPIERVSINADLSWQHIFGSDDPASRLAFAGGDHFTITGTPMAQDSFGVGVNAALEVTEIFRIRAGYEGRFSDSIKSNGGFVNLEFSF